MSRRSTKKQFSSLGVEVPEDLHHQPAIYHHPDPILRRLRLEDPQGVPIPDLKSYFRDIKVVCFYFGGIYGEASLREFHRDLVTLSMKERKQFALIYVSTDTKYEEMKSVVQGKPWLRMTFHDGSDFAAISKTGPPEVEELLRGEDFVLSHELGEYEIPGEGAADPLEYDYVRPLSRAGLASHIGALKTPTLTIYHLPSHRILDRFARVEQFRPGQVGKYMQLWKEGRTGGVSARDIFQAMRWSLLLALLVGLYKALVFFGGSQYDFIPDVMTRISSGNFFPDRAGAATTEFLGGAAKSMPTLSVTRATI
ncbi:hypothetical protein BDY24DRAFT_380526 [Mrakia frigida]|uniref:uncharacterized protein n=1 Tax=Mrakia frigida TaxID=29902 RepID=UPI003FCC1DF2